MKEKMNSQKLNSHRNPDKETESSLSLQMLINSIPIPIFYTDIKGICLGGNQKFSDFLGKKTENIVGQTIPELISYDLAEINELADNELHPKGEVHTYEKTVLHADGSRHFVVCSKTIFINQDGKPGGMIYSIFDITRRKEFELQLRRNEERYRRIFENIQDVYYEVELDGTILEISPSIEKYSPFKREDLIGRSIYEFYVDKDRRKDFLEIISDRGYVRDFEIHLRDHQDGVWTCSITSALMAGDGERSPWIVGSMRDITERKLKEEILRQREEELSVKSKNLEEVNTALKVLLKQREEDRKEIEENVLTNVNASILPYLEKLKEGPLTHHQKAYLDILCMQMREIISPFRRMMSRTMFDLTPQETQVADLVKHGNTTKEIAGVLGISIKTVDFHRDNIRRKLGIKNHQTNLRSFLLKLT